MTTRQALCTAALLMLMSGYGTRACAEQTDVLGDLTCTLGAEATPSKDNPPAQQEQSSPGPSQTMICSFLPAGSAAEEVYSGTLFVAADALAERNALVWVVKGPRDARLEPGSLAQTYTARTALAEGKVGPLVGEFGDTITLHPLNGQAPAAAVELKLKSTLG